MTGQDDLNELRSALLAGLEDLAETLLGAPSIRKPRTWRWGSKGSLSLELHGCKRGSWHDHESGQGGGPLHLVQRARSCSVADAIAWSRNWARLPKHERSRTTAAPERSRKAADAKEAADKADRIKTAHSLWARSTPVAGTPAAQYLTNARAIPTPSLGWPDPVRFHASTCSLIVLATTTAGALQAVQRVHLTLDGRKAEGTAGRPSKVTNGVLTGAVVRLPGDPTGPLLLAEGPETGLSVWTATGHETWITLGSVAKAALPIDRKVVIARDDDVAWSPADRKLRERVKAWQADGIRIAVATPWPERRGDKSDFNDTMQIGGPDAVRARIAAALAPMTTPSRKPVLEARHIMDVALSRFFDAADQHDPEGDKPAPVHAARVDVAVGKSLRARQGAVALLVNMRTRGDDRTVVFAVPTHALGVEAAAEFEAMPAARAAGLTADIWRGRSAADPDNPGELMCRDLNRVTDAQDASQPVQTACCKAQTAPGAPVVQCPFFDVCGYQAQRRRSADVWFVPHEMLFTERPAAIGDVAVVVVDEAAWQDGLEGEHGHPIELTLDSLAADDTVPGDPLAGQRLRFLRGLALEALRGAADGPVLREAMEAVGLTPQGAAEAHVLEWRRKVDAGMHPAMTAAERKAAARAAEGNRTVRRLAMFWRAIEALLRDGGPAASGWAALAWSETKEGQARVLRLKGRKPVREGWQAPTLLLDATLNVDLVRPFWPTVELVADVAAETPHQHIRQVVDRSYSKRYLELHDDLDDDERRIRTRHLRSLNATLAAIGRNYAPGRTLVVAQKAIKESLPSVGMLPPTVELAHHNAVAGLDCWRNFAALVVVGRTAPPPDAVARIAEALTGSAVPLLTGWYSKVACGREMADGSTFAAECDRHPDPVCEAIRWHICEGELVQIIGRARGVNRTEADPVNVWVMTDAPLPLPLVETISAADRKPSPSELMLGVGGIAYENAAHAAAAYPELWPNREAAKKALVRRHSIQMGTFPYRRIYIRECPHLDRVDYQRAGARMGRAVAWFDPTLITDPAAVLGEKLGPLAWATVAETAMPPDEPSRRPDPTVIAAMADAEKLTLRAKLQAGSPPPDPLGAAPEVLDGYGEGIVPAALFPASTACAPGLWTIMRHGSLPDPPAFFQRGQTTTFTTPNH